MIKKLLAIASILMVLMPLNAQNTPAPCGTPPYKSPWLRQYQKNPANYDKGGDTMLYVPITIHLVGNDAGSGYFSVNSLLTAFCQLNADFEPVKIQFFMEGDFDYIPNGAFNAHETVLDGANFMFQYNVDNTLNCYFVQDPAGNCGYNLPYAGIANAKGCVGPGDHTWTHEVGHGLHLPHPFYGWEGNVYDYNTDTPYELVHDAYTFFQDTFVSDPNAVIIDTNYVELLDGSNCTTAADGFCDTQADYLNYRWQCDTNNISIANEKDPTGAFFKSDGSLYMSYSLDGCQNRFSDEQTAAMRAFLLTERTNWLYNQDDEPQVVDAAELLSPINDETVQFDAVSLEWAAVPNATNYYLQLSRFSNFSVIEKEFTTTETTYNLSLVNNKTYYWRVRPYNRLSFCQPMGAKVSFKTSNISSANTIKEDKSLMVSPNPIAAGETLAIYYKATAKADINIQVLDVNGRVLYTQNASAMAGNNRFEIPTSGLVSGMYMVAVQAPNTATIFRKIIVAMN